MASTVPHCPRAGTESQVVDVLQLNGIKDTGLCWKKVIASIACYLRKRLVGWGHWKMCSR